MKIRFSALFWFCLILSLITALPGFVLRTGNEQRNKTVISAVDYYEFSRAADMAHTGLDGVLNRLKAYGASAVAIREITLGDLQYKGDIYVSTAGEFLSSARADQSDLRDRLREAAGKWNVNPSSLLIITSDAGVAGFLTERLGSRFKPGDLFSDRIADRAIFCVNADLTDRLGMGLGFDSSVLADVKAMGFDILLRPKNSPGSNDAYINEYDRLIGEFGAKYIIFDGMELPGYKDSPNAIIDIAKRHGLITGIIEPASQTGYVPQKGLENLITGSGYAINRAYIISDADLEKLDAGGLFFRWYRSVVDRSVRFIYIRPLRSLGLSYYDNIENTIGAVHDFNAYMASKGFAVSGPVQKLSDKLSGRVQNIKISFSLLFAFLLYLIYLLKPRLRLLAILFFIGAAGCLSLNMLFELPGILVLAASVVYPSLSGLLLLKYLKSSTEKHYIARLLTALYIVLGVNALGAYTIVSTMSDIRYSMDILFFNWVAAAFTVPVILHMVNYMVCFRNRRNLLSAFKSFLNRSISLLEIVLLAALTVAFIVYIARSGNNMGISATDFELRIREVFEKQLFVRPRFKEILVGYPSLFIMVYLYHRYKSNAAVLFFGLGAVIAGVSVINSFCHVFTAVAISFQRSVNGLAIGSAAGAASVFMLMCVLPAYDRHARKPAGESRD